MDDMHARTPVNKTAALVIGSGVHFEPNKRIQNNDSDTPLRLAPITNDLFSCPGFADLTGMKVGRFVVLGKSADFKGSWVVRCACGKYSTRRSKAIKNLENTQDRCEHCRHLAYLKREEFRHRTGKDADIRDF